MRSIAPKLRRCYPRYFAGFRQVRFNEGCGASGLNNYDSSLQSTVLFDQQIADLLRMLVIVRTHFYFVSRYRLNITTCLYCYLIDQVKNLILTFLCVGRVIN
jgi:hypothetical protein